MSLHITWWGCIPISTFVIAQVLHVLAASKKAYQHKLVDEALARANLINAYPHVYHYYLAAINVDNYVFDFRHIYYQNSSLRRVELVKVAFVLPLPGVLCSGRKFGKRDIVSLDETAKWVWLICMGVHKVPSDVFLYRILPFLGL